MWSQRLICFFQLLLLAITSGATRFSHFGGIPVGSGKHAKQVNGTGGLLFPLKMRPGTFRGHEARALLANGTMALHGAIKDLGYFYAEIFLGTPAQKFAVIVDTGSTMTTVPCSDCKVGKCGPNKLNERFNPEASSTYEKLPCSDPRCHCGSPACACSSNQCAYSRFYAESSSSSGHLISDVMHLGDSAVRVNFGCETHEGGEIFRQAADGIMGLGASDVSVPFQMAASGAVESMFSLCFGDMHGEGALMIGNVPLPHELRLHYVPLVANRRHPHYYNINMHGLTLGKTRLNIAAGEWTKGYGSVLDSGTTFTYLTRDSFNAFKAGLDDHHVTSGLESTDGPDPHYRDICWAGASENPFELRRHFPTLTLHLDNGFDFELEPMNYLFVHSHKRGAYCLGVFDNGNSGNLLGGITFRNVLLQYDRREGIGRVGMAHAPCRVIGQGGCWPPNETSAIDMIGRDGDWYCHEGVNKTVITAPETNTTGAADKPLAAKATGSRVVNLVIVVVGVAALLLPMVVVGIYLLAKRRRMKPYSRFYPALSFGDPQLDVHSSTDGDPAMLSAPSGGVPLEDISLQTPRPSEAPDSVGFGDSAGGRAGSFNRTTEREPGSRSNSMLRIASNGSRMSSDDQWSRD